MTPEEQELHEFLRLFHWDMVEALQIAHHLANCSDSEIAKSLIRDMAVCYARPFSTNFGNLVPKHQLKRSYVPKALLPLHKELNDLRNSLFAHSDLRVRKPKVVKAQSSRGTIHCLTMRTCDYDSIQQRLPQFQELISSVESALSAEFRHIEESMK
jgi:hypothetical protein